MLLKDRMQRLRFEKGLTAKELADLAGPTVSESFIQSVESGEAKSPSFYKLLAVAQALEMHLSEFMVPLHQYPLNMHIRRLVQTKITREVIQDLG